MKDKLEKRSDKIKKKEHPFSEELSDSGERNKIIKKQTKPDCGGL